MKTMIAALIMAVAATATAQQTNTLDTLRQAYEKKERSALAEYGKALDTTMTALKKKGDLDNVLVLQAEQKRFEAEKTVPASTDAKDPFRPASEAYGQSMVTLLGQYVKTLDALIKKEVAADRIEEAKAIKTEKDKAEFMLADAQTKLPVKAAAGKLDMNQQATPQPAQRSIFERSPATFRLLEGGKVKDLKKGCILYTDKDHTMKDRPTQLISTSYVMAPFSGCTVVCEREGVAFALGLFDPWNAGQTDAAKSYLEKNDWTRIEAISPFVLFYWNGGDRPAEAYWKEIKKGEELSFPAGMVLCFKKR